MGEMVKAVSSWALKVEAEDRKSGESKGSTEK